ncbi:hypothetical protein BKA80DRAFT_11783 [Phyllosticta citrichinensis]
MVWIGLERKTRHTPADGQMPCTPAAPTDLATFPAAASLGRRCSFIVNLAGLGYLLSPLFACLRQRLQSPQRVHRTAYTNDVGPDGQVSQGFASVFPFHFYPWRAVQLSGGRNICPSSSPCIFPFSIPRQLDLPSFEFCFFLSASSSGCCRLSHQAFLLCSARNSSGMYMRVG